MRGVDRSSAAADRLGDGYGGRSCPVGAHCSGWLPGWLLRVFRTGTLGAREGPAPGARACPPRPGAAEQTGNCWRGAPNG